MTTHGGEPARLLLHAGLEDFHVGRGGSFLGRKNAGGAAGTAERDIYIVKDLEGSLTKGFTDVRDGEHTRPAVAGGRSAQADDKTPRAGIPGRHEEFSDAPGRRQQGIALIPGKQLQPASLGHFHKGDAAGEQVCRLNRPAQRVGHPGIHPHAAKSGRQYIQQPFAAVGQGTFHHIGPGERIPEGIGNNRRNLPGREAFLE